MYICAQTHSSLNHLTHTPLHVAYCTHLAITLHACLALNSLLHQVVEHVLSSRKVGEEARPPPFAMTTTTIGPLALLSLDEKSGSAGWTPVIVRLAHNLQWLIDVAALLD